MTDEAILGNKKISRREFLNFAWLVSIGFFTFTTAGVSYLFALPRFREGEFGGDYTVGPVSELPNTSAPPTNIPKVKLWISNTEGGLLALYKVCTHLGCLYNWNTQEVKFICPCHGSQFEKDGTYIKGPAPRNLDRFIIQIQSPDGQVLAETDSESGKALPLPDNPNAIVVVNTGRRINGERHG
jgi:cytochrome b6-f complex iron-sulfur subunit